MKRRLLLVSPLPPPAGGIATWTKRLLTSPLAERYHIRVVDTNTGRAQGQVQGLTASKAGLAALFVARLLRALAVYRPHVVHVNTAGRFPRLALEGAFLRLARLAGAHTVLHQRGSLDQAHDHTPPGRRQAWARIFGRADRVLVLHHSALELLGRYGIPGHQVPNFVADHDPHDRAARGTEPVQVVFVGWVMAEKGVLELIEAMSRLPDAELVLVGRAVHDVERALETALAGEAVRGRVTRTGEVPLEAVWDRYDAADIFVLPSWTEGFPNTVVEAMMAGLPVVATRVGALPEIVVHGETGLLVPARDPDALTEALGTLVASRERRLAMGAAGRERAIRLYARDVVVHQLGDHYDALVSRASRA